MNKALDDMSLFDACDLMRTIDPCTYSEADDAIIFRCLQREKIPSLSDAQVMDLFHEWQEHYATKRALDRRDAVEKIMRFAEAHAKENPDPNPFRCVCGAETRSADDPEFFKIHGPHIAEAAKARIEGYVMPITQLQNGVIADCPTLCPPTPPITQLSYPPSPCVCTKPPPEPEPPPPPPPPPP